MTRDALVALEKFYSFTERSTTEVQQEILRVLEHDGYLTLKNNGYVFVSRLLRDWWKARYDFSYVPILGRGA